MNRLGYYVFVVLITISFSSCNSGNDGKASSTGTKYLAKNIILNASPVSTAYAQSATIDTTTQILANNVIFEAALDSEITSSNVQSAMEEISQKLSKVLVGTWNIQNYNQESLHEATGKVTINNDGTFDLTAGSFAAIGMGSGTAADPFCTHTAANQTYQAFTDDLIVFVHYNGGTRNSVIPRLVKLRKDEVVFVGDGGCGQMGLQRISVLTRVL